MPLRKIPYTGEQRRLALGLVAGGTSQAETARQLGVAPMTVSQWVHAAGGCAYLRGEGKAKAQREFHGSVTAEPPREWCDDTSLSPSERAMRVPAGQVEPFGVIAQAAAPESLHLSSFAASKVVTEVAKGLPPEIACESIGLAPNTWEAWQMAAASGDNAFCQWVSVIRSAMASAIHVLQEQAVAGLAEARGSMWTLQRLRPEIYDPKPPVESHTDAGGLRDLPQETIDAVLRKKYGACDAPKAGECVDLSDIGVVTDATKQ